MTTDTSWRMPGDILAISDPRVRDILQLAQQILLDNAQRVLACQIIK